jgi:ABC-type lipoprotein release transport system permease subunit
MMDRLRLLSPLAWRSLWRNPRRTIITLLVVSVGLWSILIFAVLLQAWGVSSRNTTLRLMTGEGQIHASGYLDDPTAGHAMVPPSGRLADVLASPAVAARAPRVRVSAIVQSEYKTLPVTLAGVVPRSEWSVSDLPRQIAEGRYLSDPDDAAIVLGRNLARRLKTRVGKRLVVMTQDAQGHLAERSFEIVGLYAAGQAAEDQFAFTGLRPAQALTGVGDAITEIAFDAAPGRPLPSLIADLEAAAPGLDVQSWQTLAPLSYAMSTFFDQFIVMWLWVMFALMAIGIVNTQLMAVFERSREFALLQALGMRPRLVLWEVALESVMLVGLGVLTGLLLALISVQAFPNGIDLGFMGRGAEILGGGRVLHPQVDASGFALYGAIVWVAGVIAALWPAWRASRMNPVEAMTRD